MADDHRKGMFSAPDPQAAALALGNVEYQAAFQMFDKDGSQSIDLVELSQALQAVKQSVEGGTRRQTFPSTFNPNTVLFLAAKFGSSYGGGLVGQSLSFPQFAPMLQYLEGLKQIFSQIDTDNTGDLDVSELSRALNYSGFNVTPGLSGGNDSLSMQVAQKIGQAYDADGNGVLSFDEFTQLRCEWDVYITAWNQHVLPGSNQMEPGQILAVLEDIKKSLEPVGMMAMNPGGLANLAGFNGAAFNGLYFNSMFTVQRPFLVRTCEMLIIRFGNGNITLTFEQFCMLMEFLKQQKKIFMQFDLDRSGSLGLAELVNAFNASGIPLPAEQVQQIGQRYDQDNSGEIEFDEFLQMMAEWSQVSSAQSQFANFAQERATAFDLQKLFPSITMFYRTINGAIPTMRPFSLSTCRTLVAMFGTPQPGEPFAQGVTYPQFLMLMQRVKQVACQFAEADFTHDGTISGQELKVAMRRSGSMLPDVAIMGMLASHDVNHDGRLAFDEFLQMLLDAELFHSRIMSLPSTGLDAGGLYQLLYSMPRTLYR